MILLHIYGLIVFLYVTFRLILPSPLGYEIKWLLIAVAFVGSQYYLVVRLFSGSLASPEMPYPLLVAFSLCFVTLAVLFALLVIRDLALLVFALVKLFGVKGTIPFSPSRRAFAVAALGGTLGVYGFQRAVAAPGVHTTEITLERLPKALDGLTIAHITDLHATALLHGPRVAEVVKRVNALNPDLILTTGDLIDGTPLKRKDDVAPLKDLRAKYGVYGCDGNHEYYSGYAEWMKTFGQLGISMLHNENRVLTIKGERLVIAGINDPAAARFGKPGPDMTAALTNIPEDVPVVLLAHQPGFARANAAYPVDLQLSGHTHGGQMWGFDQLVASRNDGFLRGLYRVGNMQLYVGTGAGLWTGFPIRLGVPSEIARIVLRSAQ
ncbi:MAG: hypothetical protein DELT_01585 [Desulfovibrio sp.]